MRRPDLVWNAGRPPPRMLTMVIAGVDQARGLQTHLGSREAWEVGDWCSVVVQCPQVTKLGPHTAKLEVEILGRHTII